MLPRAPKRAYSLKGLERNRPKRALTQWPGRVPGMIRGGYQTNLTNAEWALIEPHLPAPRAVGTSRLRLCRSLPRMA
jgi:hypothetical protein